MICAFAICGSGCKWSQHSRSAPQTKRTAYVSAHDLRIEVFMRPDREQHQLLGRQLVGLQPVGQQSLLLVEFEFVDEHAAEVAPFFFA